MTSLCDILGNAADDLLQANISVGDVHLLNLDRANGITPKNGEPSRDKFFIVLGFDSDGNVIGGLVINSKVNYNLPPEVTCFHMPVTVDQCPFLRYNSFVNCSRIIIVKRSKFTRASYRGTLSDSLLEVIVSTVKESPTISKRLLKDFGIE